MDFDKKLDEKELRGSYDYPRTHLRHRNLMKVAFILLWPIPAYFDFLTVGSFEWTSDHNNCATIELAALLG
jgi:hypothetical protein